MSNKLNQFNNNVEFASKDNTIADKLQKTEHGILVYSKKNENIDFDTFFTDMRLYLKKMPKNNVTENVFKLLNSNGIFLGLYEKKKEFSIYSRILLTTDNKLAGVVLETADLNIGFNGETDNIDNCIYATYFALIRASLKCNPETLKTDYDLHKLCTSYLFNLFLKSLGKSNSFNKLQLDGIHLSCAYCYMRHYLQLTHSSAVSRLNRVFIDVVDKNNLEKLLPSFELVSNYNSLKDIGKVLISLDVLSVNPNKILLLLIQNFGKLFFYNIMGSLPNLIATIIITNYPTDLVGNVSSVNSKLESIIEKFVVQNYLNKLKYSIISV